MGASLKMRNTKLELTWVGKGEDPILEPRILIEDPEKSYGDKDTGNMLIKGDNLLALKALEQDYTGKVKCIYIDPPYNTGQAFEHYDDGLEHSIWLKLMNERFKILKTLLTDDGIFFCQVNDDEMAYAKVLLDEVFGRNNFLNQISVKMKETSGASGGGEDKKLKKNIEYIIVYTKNKFEFSGFNNNVFDEVPLMDLIENMKLDNKSWKYTRVITDGLNNRFLINETQDGSGEKIKIYAHPGIIMKTVKELISEEGLTEEECYSKYYDRIFRDTNAQSSIRTRVIDATSDQTGDFFSIDYIPRSARNKNKLTTLYYKGNNRDLIAWLKDICVKKNGSLVKLEKPGTYWDGFPLNNLTKEGSVKFPNGKKPELLIKKIIELSTLEGDLILDSFLGSGTTAAVAHKMGRKYIGIELGEHCDTHCLPRLKKVVDGTDQGGISKTVNWQGGGGFRYYNLAPSLLKKDHRDNYIINPEYNAEMLAAAMAKHEGFTYNPCPKHYWKQGFSTETDYIFVTTQSVTVKLLDQIYSEMGENESLLVCCKAYSSACKGKYPTITIKKIPKMIQDRCEFDKEDYSLHIVDSPLDELRNEPESIEDIAEAKPKTQGKAQKDSSQLSLFK